MGQDEKKLEHLKMIQEIIIRMSGYGFQLKNAGVVLVAALLAFAATGDNERIAWLTLIPLSMFWALDGVFLQLERQYRALFEDVRQDPSDRNYDLKPSVQNISLNSWKEAVTRPTLMMFWGGLCGLAFVLILWTTRMLG